MFRWARVTKFQTIWTRNALSKFKFRFKRLPETGVHKGSVLATSIPQLSGCGNSSIRFSCWLVSGLRLYQSFDHIIPKHSCHIDHELYHVSFMSFRTMFQRYRTISVPSVKGFQVFSPTYISTSWCFLNIFALASLANQYIRHTSSLVRAFSISSAWY